MEGLSFGRKLVCQVAHENVSSEHSKCIYLLNLYSTGNSAWCSKTRSLLVWNLSDSIDIYHIMDRPALAQKLRLNVARMYAFQVEFAQHGNIVVCGTGRGEVCMWEANTQQMLSVLAHGHGTSFWLPPSLFTL